MKQVSRVLANYSADLFGVCSALYELGGMTVMDDASGCNSTYDTHDEPRWYDMDSMVYITALTESDAVMGNDAKIIEDVCEVAAARHPKFIALCGSVIPLMMGTDFQGIAHLIEKRTGIPSFGIATGGMDTYTKGAGEALKQIAVRFCPDTVKRSDSSRMRINLLGVTPLDFSVNGSAEALKRFFEQNGCTVLSTWAMGSTLEELSRAGDADINVVVSSTGLPAAETLKKKYSTPFVCGIPMGTGPSEKLLAEMHSVQYHNPRISADIKPVAGPVWLIGEPVFCASLRNCLELDFGAAAESVHVICPMETTAGVLRNDDLRTDEEDDIAAAFADAGTVIADPIYRRILPANSCIRFIGLPHEAYSGRMYRNSIPVIIGSGFKNWLEARLF